MSLTNYHSHTTRCLHASGTEEEYILEALRIGYDVLGFADHSPWPYKSDFVATMRMRYDELDDYLQTLRMLREKYRSRIELRIGLECEAFPEFYPWMRNLKKNGAVEYFILGNHYDTTDENNSGFYFGRCSEPRHLYRYMETTIAGMDSDLFVYLAHPDLFLHRYRRFDAAAREVSLTLAKEAKRLDLPLEYNLLGLLRHKIDCGDGYVGYTSDAFWETAAEIGGRAIIGVDAHSAAQLDCLDLYAQTREKLTKLGFEIVDRLNL